MKRRAILLGGAASAALAATRGLQAQAAKRRIGVLLATNREATRHLMKAFTERMTDLGWTEGSNIEYHLWFAESRGERYERIAKDAVEHRVDLLFAPFGPVAVEAKKLTRSIPIVFASVTDPVALGLAASLARPGGNATGVTTRGTALTAKRMQLLKEVFPSVRTVGVLFNRESGADSEIQETLTGMDAAARALGMRVVRVSMAFSADFGPAIDQLRRDGADAILGELAWYQRRREFIDAIGRARLPAAYATTEFADEGGLMALAVNYEERYRAAAGYVDRILRGAKPGDLAVEEPTRLELTINLKTAAAHGVKIPHSVMVRADKVIQ